MIRTLALTICLNLALSLAGPQVAAAGKGGYRIVDLGALAGYPLSTAYAVNDSGHIIGVSIDPAMNVWRTTLWTPSGSGWVARDIFPGLSSSFPSDISSTGLVVATADTPTGMTTRRAYVWSGGDPIPLSSEPSEARGVNSAGTLIAGYLNTDTSHAVAWSSQDGNWLMAGLPGLPDSVSSVAVSASDNGLVVGGSSSATLVIEAVVWARDILGTWAVTRLPSLAGATFTNAIRIDRRFGTSITGESGSRIQRHAVLWTLTSSGGWAIRDLGALPRHCCSSGEDINTSGQVIGNSEAAGLSGHPESSTATAFIWTSASGMRALPALANRSWGNGINANGLIVGTSSVTRDPMAAIHAVVWSK